MKKIKLFFKHNVLHILWLLFIVVYSFLSFFIDTIQHGFAIAKSQIESNGSFYLISVSVLAPCVFTLLYKIIETKPFLVKEPEEELDTKRISLVIIGIILCTIIPLLQQGNTLRGFFTQTLISVFCIGYSFLCYILQFDSWKKKEDNTSSVYTDDVYATKEIVKQSDKSDFTILNGEEVKI